MGTTLEDKELYNVLLGDVSKVEQVFQTPHGLS